MQKTALNYIATIESAIDLKKYLQIIRFAGVGAINTAVDFLILNALIFAFGTGKNNKYFIIFKAISFLTALCNSYLLNKYWVFKQAERESKLQEGILFAAVSGVGFLLNIIISTVIFNYLSNTTTLNQHLAATLGAVAGSVLVLAWNFAGYKFFVFKK